MARATGTTGRLGALFRLLPQGRSLPSEVWEGRHKGILGLLWAHSVAIPIFGLVRGFSPEHMVLETLIVPATAVVATSSRFGRRVRTAVASLGLLSCSAVLVHLSGGTIEMHFHFFVMVTVVALYQDWFPFLTSIGYVLVHHGLAGALDPESVYNHMAAWRDPWTWAGIHAFFIAGISAVCLVTWRLNEMVLSQRAAIAADNARLYQSEREARISSEFAQQRLALLADVSKVLTSSLRLDAILPDLARLLTRSAADFCAIDTVDEAGSLTRVASEVQSGLSWQAGTKAPPEADRSHPVTEAIRSGTPRFLEGDGALRVVAPLAEPAEWDLLSVGNRPDRAIVVPLRARRGIVGALSVVAASESVYRLTEHDLPFFEELARRAAIALENALLYARQRTVAETLQHSLLPERLPDIPGLVAAARYIPGGPDVEIGGDWYDVLLLPDGSTVLAMGDVVGRGEGAASLMGQLRNALRAYSLDGKSPEELVGGLSHLLHGIGAEKMATMIYGVFEPEAGTLRFVNAGHPPPLVIGPDGETTFLEGGGGVPIGSVRQPHYREAVTTLVPGSTLVLYTDGLVESRDLQLEDGLERLRRVASSEQLEPDALCDHVIDRLLGGQTTSDDAAILAVKLVPLGPHLRMTLPSQPSVLAPLRAVLRRWLAASSAGEEESFEILVAAGEACSNAIRHGTANPAGPFEFEALLDGGVAISVRDHGTWRIPRVTGGGRGLDIIAELMDDVDISRAPDGTEVKMFRRLPSPADRVDA